MPETVIPALARGPYHSHGNMPAGGNNTTQAIMHAWDFWSVYAFLTGQTSGGTTKNTRNAASLWTVVRTCDSVSVSTSDLLGGSTFNATKWVRNSQGSAHSWAHLRNAVSGYDCVIALNSPSNGTGAIRFIPTAVGTSTGTTTASPTATGSLGEFLVGVQGTSAGAGASLFADFTTLQVGYAHFVCDAYGNWLYFRTRSGLGLATAFFGFWAATGGRASDTRNVWTLYGGSSTSGRGSPAMGTLNGSTGALRRHHDDTAPSTGVGLRSFEYASQTMAGVGTDPLSADGDYLVSEIEVGIAASTRGVKCGVLPDLYLTSGGAIGSPVPADPPDMERVVLGDMIIPFGVVPFV